MLRSFNRTALAIAAGATASTFIGVLPAAAQEAEITVRGTLPGVKMQLVSYRDLNLNLIAHRKVLNTRVERAVRKVCDLKQVKDELGAGFRACSDAAWAGARPQVNRAYVQAARMAYRR